MNFGFLGPNDVDGIILAAAEHKIGHRIKMIDLSLEILANSYVALDYSKKKIRDEKFISSSK
jgi:hypothetical protein